MLEVYTIQRIGTSNKPGTGRSFPLSHKNATPCYILTIACPVSGTTGMALVATQKEKRVERYRTAEPHKHVATEYITPKRQ